MNKIQWLVLSIAFVVLGSYFIFQDNMYRQSCMNTMDKNVASPGDVWACINSEIYDPFIEILMFLGAIIFPIMAWLEPAHKG